jgi:Tfp pilus assembly protein PilN
MDIRLNLIPPEKKKEISNKTRVSASIKIEIFLTIVLIVFIAVLFSFNYILKLNLNSVLKAEQKSLNSGKYDKLKEYDENFSQINKKLSNVVAVEKSQLYWSRLFSKLNNFIFPGIKISSLSTSDYLVTLQGISDTRDNLILFKDKLSSEECFSEVGLPLDDLVDKNNVVFKIDFFVDKNCLKNK